MLSYLSRAFVLFTGSFALRSRVALKIVNIKRPNIIDRRFHSFQVKSPRILRALTSLAAMSTTALSKDVIKPPVEFFRKDYIAPKYYVSDVALSFQLAPEETVVSATSKVLRKFSPSGLSKTPDLFLEGEELDLLSVVVNGIELIGDSDFRIDDGNLVISGDFLANIASDSTGSFTLQTKVRIRPDKNLALSGLYKSGASLLCTQCEAMGFRRITFHQDRPDVLTRYTVRLEADKSAFPILLSNGNRVEIGEDATTGRHWAIWEDPYPKPSYLFALVAGSLGSIHDTFVTASGRKVQLGIFSDKENVEKLGHAMYSLKEAMRWDEETFGLECDLDVYNVVATNDFNMGAMENKGLNIFNSAYVLADQRTATDVDYERILGVIGHEYFHNWSGNRVTVRDWFQLTLKEGLTVFRDQWFSSDVTSHAVKRVEDVTGLRSRQFPEDQGPMAHPIRPESYISMDNFYTATVYVKGAEVVRMYRTLLGEEGFKKGLKLYFQRHDGSAVTCDDFRFAMQDANNVDLTQFERWYSQSGTPIVDVAESYDAAARKFTLTLSQRTPTTPGQGQSEEEKLPFVIPVVTGLLSRNTGKEVAPSTLLTLTEKMQSFVFEGIEDAPIASVLRDFSAPVRLNFVAGRSDPELAFLMAHDTDSFNKWDASVRLASSVILSLVKDTTARPSVKDIAEAPESCLPNHFIDAVGRVLTSYNKDSSVDLALIAYSLQLPSEVALMQEIQGEVDIDRLHAARGRVKKLLGSIFKKEFRDVYDANAASRAISDTQYVFSSKEVSRRRLRNTALDYLTAVKSAESAALAKAQFDDSADCMTDKVAALGCLISHDCPERTDALAAFYKQAYSSGSGDALVLNKWFTIQTMGDLPDLLDRVKALKTHPDFIISNPNRARSLIAAFAGNLAKFHAPDGSGYQFIADCIIELDQLNPQVAARMAASFSQWRRFDRDRQWLMQSQLQRIKDQKLSKDTFEVVQRCLN